MPIREWNYSEVYYEIGRNLVFRDTNRCRSDSWLKCGPTEKLPHYLPPYENPSAKLPFQENLALPGPSAGPIDNVPQSNPLSEYDSRRHVIPRPLVEKIVSVSGIGRRPNPRLWYYSSPMRAPWAESELRLARKALEVKNYERAADHFSSVFGTLLPGLMCKKQTEEESALMEEAWRGLSFLVDPNLLMTLLKQSATDSPTPREEISGIISIGDALAVATKSFYRMPIGTEPLVKAEQIKALSEQIEEIEHDLSGGRLGHKLVYMRSFEDDTTFCLLSPIVKYSAWAWNFTDNEAQIIALTRPAYSWIQRVEEKIKASVHEARVSIGFNIEGSGKKFLSVRGQAQFTQEQLQVIESLPLSSFGEIRSSIDRYNDRVKLLESLIKRREEIVGDMYVKALSGTIEGFKAVMNSPVPT